MKWNLEWIDLQNIERMIAECWRMNERQLEKYCRKLSRQKDLEFAGELGIKFLDLMCSCIDAGNKPDWPKLQKDVRLMMELIQDGQGQHEIYWKSQYQELASATATYFSTKFGKAFTDQLAAKLDLDLSEEQRMLQQDIRKIQKICASCRWEDEEKAKTTVSLLVQDEKYYFSSWLGDAFINVLQQRYGKKEEDEEEAEPVTEPPEIQPKPKVIRRSSLKAKIAWTLVVCISAGAAVLWLYMQSKNGPGRLKLQNLMSGAASAAEEVMQTVYTDQEIVKNDEKLQSQNLTAGWEDLTGNSEDKASGKYQNSAGTGTSGQQETGTGTAENNAGTNDFSQADTAADGQAAGEKTSGQTDPGGTSGYPDSIQASGQAEDSAGGKISGYSDSIQASGQPEGSAGGKTSMDLKNSGKASAKEENTAAWETDIQAPGKNVPHILDKNTADTGSGQQIPDILPQYQTFYQNYPDLFGWLKIPGTQIDHPVMQSDDAKRGERYYYLHRHYDGTKSEAGSLFVESKSSCYPQDDNTVIYGHNMSSGLIFGILENYKDEEFFKNHQTIQFDTVYETGTYQIAAVMITRILYQEEEGFRYYRFYNYHDSSEFQQCMDLIKENQLYDTGIGLQPSDKLLMLSTCEYSLPNGRLVVVAKRVE